MENLDIITVSDSENERIDQYLSDYYDGISRSKISKLIKSEDVLVNNKKVKASYSVIDGDIISINLKALEIKPLEAEDLPIEIIYEDEDIAIINKPKGIISHPTNTIRSGTVVNFLMSRYQNLPKLNGIDRAGIVHRLDKDTSGLMVVALNEESMIKMKEIFKNRLIIKKYRAIVNGGFSSSIGDIELPIARSLKNRKLMTVDQNGKYAKTSYEVIEYNDGYSLLDIELHTGRTHQIRVHMAHISNPILGDPDYNKVKSNFSLNEQLLQAYYLSFNHPITDKELKFEINPYPEFAKYYNVIFKGELWNNISKE